MSEQTSLLSDMEWAEYDTRVDELDVEDLRAALKREGRLRTRHPKDSAESQVHGLLKENKRQADQILALTSKRRKLTLGELEAIVHVLGTPGHKTESCVACTKERRDELWSGLQKLRDAIPR